MGGGGVPGGHGAGVGGGVPGGPWGGWRRGRHARWAMGWVEEGEGCQVQRCQPIFKEMSELCNKNV